MGSKSDPANKRTQNGAVSHRTRWRNIWGEILEGEHIPRSERIHADPQKVISADIITLDSEPEETIQDLGERDHILGLWILSTERVTCKAQRGWGRPFRRHQPVRWLRALAWLIRCEYGFSKTSRGWILHWQYRAPQWLTVRRGKNERARRRTRTLKQGPNRAASRCLTRQFGSYESKN